MTSNNKTAEISRADHNIANSTREDLINMEQDISELTDFATSNPSLLGGEDVAELLEHLTNAESMAEGMESKIDGILQNLDSLLGILKNSSAEKPNDNNPVQDIVESTPDGHLTEKDKDD